MIQTPSNSDDSSNILYETLDPFGKQIRLLSFTHKDSLEIHTYDLDKAPTYAALSYTWGTRTTNNNSDQFTNLVEVNGYMTNVSANLSMALDDLYRFLMDELQTLSVYTHPEDQKDLTTNSLLYRTSKGLKEAARLFWVDALCIDQANPMERAHQVGLMHDIYTQATVVLTWLERDCEQGLQLLKSFENFEDREPWHAWSHLKYKRDHFTSKYEARTRHAFARSEYWTRLWTLQEFVLARDLHFISGHTIVAKDDVLKKASQHLDGELFGLGTHGEFMRRCQMAHGSRLASLRYLLSNFRDLQCSDPRDCVYGLLGLVKRPEGQQSPVLDADYTLTCTQLLQKLQALGYSKSLWPRQLKEAAEKESTD